MDVVNFFNDFNPFNPENSLRKEKIGCKVLYLR